MKHPELLYPVFFLASWTFAVLIRMAWLRLRCGAGADAFRYGESAEVPTRVTLANRNYMNLLELPLLFYTVCLMLHQCDRLPDHAVALAWAYAGLRVLHSLIHMTYNRVLHRLLAFAASNAVLAMLWVSALTLLLHTSA